MDPLTHSQKKMIKYFSVKSWPRANGLPVTRYILPESHYVDAEVNESYLFFIIADWGALGTSKKLDIVAEGNRIPLSLECKRELCVSLRLWSEPKEGETEAKIQFFLEGVLQHTVILRLKKSTSSDVPRPSLPPPQDAPPTQE